MKDADLASQWVTPIMTLVGVVVGGLFALLSPYINARIEKNRRKQIIKYELIDSVHTFFSLQKIYIAVLNSHRFLQQQYRNVHSINMPPDDLDKTINQLSTLMSEREERLVSNYDKFIAIESKLFSLLSEILDLFPQSIYNDLNKSISHEITYYSRRENTSAYDYSKLSFDEMNKLDINPKIREMGNELEKKSESLIKKINNILPR